jgi:hypothetical protein
LLKPVSHQSAAAADPFSTCVDFKLYTIRWEASDDVLAKSLIENSIVAAAEWPADLWLWIDVQ